MENRTLVHSYSKSTLLISVCQGHLKVIGKCLLGIQLEMASFPGSRISLAIAFKVLKERARHCRECAFNGEFTVPLGVTTPLHFNHIISNFNTSIFSGYEPQKDEMRKLHDRLCQECNSSHDEYKRLRGVIEQLSREYEDSKEIDFFRRYGMLKAMIKRSIMHLTLSKDDKSIVLIGNTAAREKEEQKKRDERLSGNCRVM